MPRLVINHRNATIRYNEAAIAAGYKDPLDNVVDVKSSVWKEDLFYILCYNPDEEVYYISSFHADCFSHPMIEDAEFAHVVKYFNQVL